MEPVKKNPGGRTALAAEQKRKNVSIRLSPDSVRRLKLIHNAGFQTSRVVDDLLEAFTRHAGLENPEEDFPVES